MDINSTKYPALTPYQVQYLLDLFAEQDEGDWEVIPEQQEKFVRCMNFFAELAKHHPGEDKLFPSDLVPGLGNTDVVSEFVSFHIGPQDMPRFIEVLNDAAIFSVVPTVKEKVRVTVSMPLFRKKGNLSIFPGSK